VFRPCPPVGGWQCAASPARNARPRPYASASRAFIENADAQDTVIDQPHLDEIIIRESGVAHRAGRDHTTVSRQVAKLADLGLVERRASPIDRRVKETLLSGAGRRVTDAIDAARHRLNTPVFAHWSDRDLLELERLMRGYVDDLLALSTTAKESGT
jgi:DNA-binding MarR family transcriptional regulator